MPKGYGRYARLKASSSPRDLASSDKGFEAPLRAYSTESDFLRALSDRLKQQSIREDIGLQRLRKRVAFDRFLARVFSGGPGGVFRLKGGYALEARFNNGARATKDVDLSTSLDSSSELVEVIQKISGKDLDDYFHFIVESKSDGNSDAVNITNMSFRVEARLNNKTFEVFPLDIGLNESELAPPDYVYTLSDLTFAQIEGFDLTIYSMEEHFAEKFYAYTYPYKNPSRVKDLVDMSLILTTFPGEVKQTRLIGVLNGVFERRADNPFPKHRTDIQPPPLGWKETFKRSAVELGLPITDYLEAHKAICDYIYGSSA